jgi:uncharacterized membrane protein
MRLGTRVFSGLVATVGALLGLSASFLLTIDKIKLLKDSQFVPSCNVSEILNCKSVMLSAQAEVFGFPNSIIGLSAFSLFLVVGIALLAGIQFPRWFWQLALGGSIAGVIFAHWLAYQTAFEIGALCPYCMIAWIGTFFILSTTIQENLRFKVAATEDPMKKRSVEKILQFMPIFHLFWLLMVLGYSYSVVS